MKTFLALLASGMLLTTAALAQDPAAKPVLKDGQCYDSEAATAPSADQSKCRETLGKNTDNQQNNQDTTTQQ